MKLQSFRKQVLKKPILNSGIIHYGLIDVVRFPVDKSKAADYRTLMSAIGLNHDTELELPLNAPLCSLSNLRFDFYEVPENFAVARCEQLAYMKGSSKKVNKVFHALLRLLEQGMIASPLPEEAGLSLHFIYTKPTPNDLLFFNFKLAAMPDGTWRLSHKSFDYTDVEPGDAMVLVS